MTIIEREIFTNLGEMTRIKMLKVWRLDTSMIIIDKMNRNMIIFAKWLCKPINIYVIYNPCTWSRLSLAPNPLYVCNLCKLLIKIFYMRHCHLCSCVACNIYAFLSINSLKFEFSTIQQASRPPDHTMPMK